MVTSGDGEQRNALRDAGDFSVDVKKLTEGKLETKLHASTKWKPVRISKVKG